MAREVAPIGTVSYNGVVFPSPYHARISCEAVYDNSGRTIKFYSYSLSIDVILNVDDFPQAGAGIPAPGGARTDLDDPFAVVRRKLQESGQQLFFTGQGFGPLSVNFATDAMFGPRPQIALWENLGAGRSAHIVWDCVFNIPECETALVAGGDLNRIASVSYAVTYGISLEGLTTRTISGSLEIFVHWNQANNPRQINQSADFWRERIFIQTLYGFHRTQSYTTSPDAKTLSFTVVDTEIPSPNPFPLNIVNIDLNESVTGLIIKGTGSMADDEGFSDSASAKPPWGITISGSVTVKPGFSKSWCWWAFRQVVSKRQAAIIKGKGMGEVGDATILPFLDLSIDEEIFGRTVSFRMSWKMMASIKTFMDAAGLFQKVTDNSWSDWDRDIADVRGPRGHGGNVALGHDASKNPIIRICAAADQSVVNYEEQTSTNVGLRPKPIIEQEKPPNDLSFLIYTCRVRYVVTGGSMVVTLTGAKDTKVDDFAVAGTTLGVSAIAGTGSLANTDARTAFIQETSIAKRTAILSGIIQKVGEPIRPDELPEITNGTRVDITGGNPPAQQDFDSLTVARPIGGLAIYTRRYSRTYLLDAGVEATIKINTNKLVEGIPGF